VTIYLGCPVTSASKMETEEALITSMQSVMSKRVIKKKTNYELEGSKD